MITLGIIVTIIGIYLTLELAIKYIDWVDTLENPRYPLDLLGFVIIVIGGIIISLLTGYNIALIQLAFPYYL